MSLDGMLGGMAGILERFIGEDTGLRMSLDEAGGGILADPGQLQQVVMNTAAAPGLPLT